ncbi:hypothetical protein SMB554_16100 [Sinorhizobium meliloti]|uniref:hypothetical protein n=1 Tax=Rhizobium meliloti TaxID=382 RepID=UPI000B5F4950|nr:hypothetical protein [Sinorhizobium meliloti]ASJ60578.1 hypothetical protein SMB554_16100 [Sinorhizobium meliloti]MCK3781794.1 hypothetical protein [Sinorhizobium meliloti]MCK3789579.1 hypothetical protein [Sinorhizobium meliloti]MCK3796524.1 hypothetical protein [Sinorhizobium meliloti]
MITREELYRLVWAMPVRRVAKQLGVSNVYVARICDALDVPKPGLGWWTRKRAGIDVGQPPLPPAKSGHPTSWARGRLAPMPIWQFTKPGHSSGVAGDGVHPLSEISGAIFAFGPPPPRGTCLVPRLPRAIDLTTSDRTFAQAIRFANRLFVELEERGHQVSVIAGRKGVRPAVDVWERPPTHVEGSEFPVRVPRWPTIATIGDVEIGLAIVENHVEREMQYIGNGEYRSVAALRRGRESEVAGISWMEWRMVPSGKLRLVAYSPAPSRPWRFHWQVNSRKGQVSDIVDDLEKAAKMLPCMHSAPTVFIQQTV